MSRKEDLLGAGSSFKRTVSARRAAIDASTSAPTEGAAPPIELPPALISINPANPRSDLGNLSELAGSMRDHGQKTAVTIMTRFSYLEANPEQEPSLEPDTKYVVIDGNSRLVAAREAGLATIKVMLDDGLGGDPDELLESALVANIHRQDLDPLDEARALNQLLKVHSTQTALARRLHRSQGWVAQRLALLGLTDALKEKLSTGEEPAELLRRVGNKPPEEQAGALAALKEKKAKSKVPETSAQRVEVPAPTQYESEQVSTASTQLSPPPAQAAEQEQGIAAVTEHVPSPRPTREAGNQAARPQLRMPWDNGHKCSEIAVIRMTLTEGLNMIEGMSLAYDGPAIERLESILVQLKEKHGLPH